MLCAFVRAIVGKVEKENLVDLKNLITFEIWGLNKVSLTETMICFKG